MPNLYDFTDFNLDVRVANGEKLPYLGYVEADISVPYISEKSVVVPALVVMDTEYRQDVPVVIGTNVLRCFRDMHPANTDYRDGWRLGMEAMSMTSEVLVRR